MEQYIEDRLRMIADWWNGKRERGPLFHAAWNDIPSETADWNAFWPADGRTPDMPGLVDAQIKATQRNEYLGASFPCLPHMWGQRGTPMTMAAYLGGHVVLAENTVWMEPVITDWEKFPVQFDAENYWVRMSRRLMEEQTRQCGGRCLITLPDLGDALTVFSMLRGVENLLWDLVESPEIIKTKTAEFVKAWVEAHRYFHAVYRQTFPGDLSWLLWAPGRTYACQCDFSTMISPAMFEEFVVPEIREVGRYLDYIAWHLDGPEEIKFLDILLSLDEIKVIQVAPGAGKPPCASPLWMPQMKKIQEKGKLVYAYAEGREELKTLLAGLAPERLFIGIA